MKKLKKIMALALSFMMVVAMSVATFAASTSGSNSYTITAPAGTHQYEIYQIFTGDLAGTVLSNLKWGVNGTGTTGEAVGQDVIDALTKVNGDSDTKKLAVIEQYATLSNPVATITNGEIYTAQAGYYLIKDKDGSLAGEEGESYTLYIVEVVGNVTISPKSDVPSFEKKIKDINDTTDDATNGFSDWQDSADYDIGDNVPFQLKGTVAANYADYKHYYFAFHDVEEKGLTFNPDSVHVFVDGTEITTGFELKTSGLTDGCTFEVVFENLKTIDSVGAKSVITVEYTSMLNEDAVLGEEGNVNKAKLEYSNNPNQTQGGKPETGETPWDNVIVFTYKVEINKVNENAEPLSGAEFTLSKKFADGTTKDIAVVKNTAGTSFTFSGLDDGEYILTETKTPSGYNTIAPITFKVTADHKIKWTTEKRTDILTSLSGDKVKGEITLTANKKEGSLSADVVNHSGSTLPSTGGMGTTIFYVIGSVLVLGAAVLLITKKRMSAR